MPSMTHAELAEMAAAGRASASLREQLDLSRAANEDLRRDRQAMALRIGDLERARSEAESERDDASAEVERLRAALDRLLVRLDTIDNEDRHCSCCGRDQSLGDNHKPRCEKAAARAALASSTDPEGGTPPAGEPCSLCEGTGIEPTFVEQDCPRCKGRGCEYGYGEDGHDPDWCGGCGGSGVVMVRAPSPSPSHPSDAQTKET